MLVLDGSLVKTVNFKNPNYIGDPCNTVRIFNDLEVDELMVLDISSDRHVRGPDLDLIRQLSDECFMPLSYGGGVRSFSDAQSLFSLGIEKVVLNTSALKDPSIITSISSIYGSQAVIVSIDVKQGFWGSETVRSCNGKHRTGIDPISWAKKVVEYGAGEILLTSIAREGTWSGFDIDLLHNVSSAVEVPVIAHGGAGNLQDIGYAVSLGGASAVALGSMVVFQKRGMGVLVNFPAQSDLLNVLN
ncbi:imidazole glycerol phosphate synthase/ glutamineamidotransferase subunit [Synechococcus sp. MVIR-18-1]|nr:imidazole glycerol phosphate synthase/ glutamineamidotransferase subunit [Synechococcus sp. MVIR-18-1]